MKLSSYKIAVFLGFLILLASVSETLGQKKLYVSPTGSDSNTGLSESMPLKSINSALEKVSAGDTVLVMPGIYKEVILFDSVNGEPENPVCLSGLSDGDSNYPVIDGGAEKPGIDLTNNWMSIKNSSWITVSGMKFINGWTFPIQVVNSSYLTFSECVFEGSKRVVSAGGPATHHILIEKCFWDQGGDLLWTVRKDSEGVDAWTSMHHESMQYFNGSLIDFNGTGGSIVIRRNKIINAFNALRWRGVKGFDTNIEIYANDIERVRDNDFEPEYYTYNLHVYHNRSHNVHRTLSVDNCDGGQVYYYGNVITMDDEDWTKQVCTGFWKIYGDERNIEFPLFGFNNSFYGSGHALRAEQKLLNLKHFNNAYFFTGDTSWMITQFDPSDNFDYDVSNAKWPEVFLNNNQEKNGIIADAEFTDPMKRDLHLRSGSPAVDAGKIMEFDNLGWKQEYSGKAPDAGAYEGSKLVEGPAFRFMLPPGVEVSYKEKPRIVKYKIADKSLTLYVSFPLDPASLSSCDVELFNAGAPVKINSVKILPDKYSIVIAADENIEPAELAIDFKKFPVGINGESMTSWASAVRFNRHK